MGLTVFAGGALMLIEMDEVTRRAEVARLGDQIAQLSAHP
jgi:hypothetical protein